MRSIAALVTALLMLAPSSAAPVPKAKPAEVELLPLATELFVGEPFEAFVRFTNRSDQEVFLSREPDLQERVGNVFLEVKGPGDEGFRCPYVVTYPRLSSDGTRDPKVRGVRPEVSRCEFLTLIWESAEDDNSPPIFRLAGEWRVRAKVVLLSGEERVSAEIGVNVAERTADESKRFTQKVEQIVRLNSPKMTTYGEEFKARLKLIEELGGCFQAEKYRRQTLGFRLSVVGTERSKETDDEVMKDIDAYLKVAS
jgi:hypothetical protein